jgi:hypothetical protein
MDEVKSSCLLLHLFCFLWDTMSLPASFPAYSSADTTNQQPLLLSFLSQWHQSDNSDLKPRKSFKCFMLWPLKRQSQVSAHQNLSSLFCPLCLFIVETTIKLSKMLSLDCRIRLGEWAAIKSHLILLWCVAIIICIYRILVSCKISSLSYKDYSSKIWI